MKDREFPPVPPLGDSALARIERGVFVILDQGGARSMPPRSPHVPHRWRRYVVAMTAAAVGVFAVIGVRELRRGSGLPARGARIVTATSPSHLTIPGASLDVAPASAIDFATEHDGTIVIVLERGAVTCEVAPRSHGAPFVVEAGATRVTVIGTRFTVTRAGDHASVSVDRGTVEVGDDGVTQLVHAGERYRPAEMQGPVVASTVELTPPALPAFEPLLDRAAAVTQLATAPLARPPARAPGSWPLPRRPRAPAATVALAGASVGPRSIGDVPRTARGPDAAFAPRPSGRPGSPEAPPPASPGRPALGQDHQPPGGALRQQRFEVAAGLEVRDPARALRIYQELASGSDPWAANALFAEARLEIEHRQLDRAHTLLGAYLQRFPRGPNAADARALLARSTSTPTSTRGGDAAP